MSRTQTIPPPGTTSRAVEGRSGRNVESITGRAQTCTLEAKSVHGERFGPTSPTSGRFRPFVWCPRHACLLLRCEEVRHARVVRGGVQDAVLGQRPPIKSAPVKSQSLKYERWRLTPRSIAPTNLQPVNVAARMSDRDRSAPLKSQCSKSFQHIRDSDRSESMNPTR